MKPSAETEKLRKEKEAAKIKEYNELINACLKKKSNHEFDAEAFNLTTKILSQNPEFYTIWNFRRNILTNGLFKDATTNQKQEVLSRELDFLQALFKLNPKSYWIFNHRRWCLEILPNPNWQMELDLLGKMLDLDSRNFHGWDYRRYVTSKLSSQPFSKTSNNPAETLCQLEFDFTTTKINQNFSNYSAWHQRSKLFPRLLEEKKMGDEEKKKIIDNEFDLVKSAIYTDPDDQSAWLYHWWLVGREIHHISILGAYFEPQERQIILAFDSEIGMIKPFYVTHGNEGDKNQNPVQGEWHPLGGSANRDQLNGDRQYGFVWIYALADGLNPSTLTVTIEPSWVVSSHSGARLARAVQMHVYTIDAGLDLPLLAATVAHREQASKTNLPGALPVKDTLPIIAIERVKLLKREIDTIRELLDLEPESKWCLQTLINLKGELRHTSPLTSEEADIINDEIIAMCNQLIKIDHLRTKRFEDLRSKAIFEKTTRSLVKPAPDAPKEIVYSQMVVSSSASPLPQTSLTMASQNITFIPTPSVLLFIFKLDVSNNKLISMNFISNLINLREVNLSCNLITRIDGVRDLKYLKEVNLKGNLISTFEALHDGLADMRPNLGRCKLFLGSNPVVIDQIDSSFFPKVDIIWD